MSMRWGRFSVSKTESFLSTFGIGYTFIGLYLITNLLLLINAAVDESRLHEGFQKYVTGIARGCGATINLNMAVVLLLASRSLIGFLQGTPMNMVLALDKAMPEMHRFVGKFLVFAGIIHSIMHWVTYLIKKPWSGGFSGFTSLFITGMILLVLILAIRVVARRAVYQSNYETFSRVHIGGSVLAFTAIVIHGLHRGVPSTWKWVVGPIVVYVLDVALRSFRVNRSYLLVSKHSAVFQGPDILKVRLPRVFHFQAGQYAELRVPELSLFQWHPFTIASAPHEPEMVFYIKAIGDWTISLYQLFGERITSGGQDIEIHIRGPFGAPAQHVGQFDSVILVGGGVGATPFCSVVKDAYNWMTNWAPQSQKNKKQRFPSGREDKTRSNVKAHPTARHDITHQIEEESHLFSTNVFSEQLNSAEIDGLADIDEGRHRRSLEARRLRILTSRPERWVAANRHMETRRTIQKGSSSATTANATSLHTARDYFSSETSTIDSSDTYSFSLSTDREDEHGRRRPAPHPKSRPTDMPHGSEAIGILGSGSVSQDLSENTVAREELGMGSYRDNSTGPHQTSLDYMTALHSAYYAENANEVYQRSLDLLVGLSFGSASLVRNVQMKHVQKNIRQAPSGHSPLPLHKQDLSVFHNQRLMFLLFMRTVTVGMVLFWTLIIRFVVAGTAYVFNGTSVFEQGLALYKSQTLTAVDLALAVVLSLLIGIPSVLEFVELGSALVHGFDLFVLTPIALFSVVVNILALAGVGRNVALFGVVHIFVVWPVLAILITIRLIRVIGERIAQAENMTHAHSSTKNVDFYWTAPTPEDDSWLVNELAPYSDVQSVQLHRYLTRSTGDEPNANISKRRAPSMHTHLGKPNWNEILNETAQQSPNNSTIGVFFCGPHSMGAQLQEACMEAMRNSIVRGLHSGAVAMRGLEDIFGEAVSANEYTGETSDRKHSGKRGCNVKFVFKRESFA